MTPSRLPPAPANPGLCAPCVHARRVESGRGSVFLLCELSRTDRRFPKYPRLPVVTCPGHQKRDAASTSE